MAKKDEGFQEERAGPPCTLKEEMQEMVVDQITREHMEQNIEFIDWWGDQLSRLVKGSDLFGHNVVQVVCFGFLSILYLFILPITYYNLH